MQFVDGLMNKTSVSVSPAPKCIVRFHFRTKRKNRQRRTAAILKDVIKFKLIGTEENKLF